MSMAKIRFSRKTLAVALAVGVSVGGVTVPQFAGAEGMTAVASAAEAGKISPTSPFPEVKETMFDRAYKLSDKLSDAEPGSRTMLRVLASPADIQNGKIVIPGLFEGVPDDKIDSISNFYGETGGDDAPFVRGKDYPEVFKMNQLKSVRVEENGDFVISLLPGAKRIVNVIDIALSNHTTLSISPAVGTREHAGLNFVTKNSDGTISGELAKRDMSHLVANGGTYVYDIYGFPLLGQEPGVEVEPSDFSDGDAGKLVTGGVVARIPGQGVWKIDNDAGTIKFTPEPDFDGTPTFPRIGLVDSFNISGLIYTPAQASSSDVAPLPDVMKRYTFVDMQYVMPEEYRPEAEKDPDFNPNTPTPSPAEDLHVTNVKKDDKGNYIVTRSDGEDWTIDLSDIRDKLVELENKETVSPGDFKKVQDDLDKVKKDVEDLKTEDEALQKEINKIQEDVTGLDKRVTDLEKRVTELEKSVIKEVKNNGDGTYTLIRNNGDEVPGKIDTSGSVTDVKTDGKGNLVITIDGKDKKVPLNQVKVTEENKGTPNHTVTITTPDGKSVTFNVFDTYVTDIKWNEAEGVYEIYRSDVDGGKTVWKTIDLSDLRNRIDALEKKDSPSRHEYNTLVKEVRENRELIEKLKEQIEGQNAADQEKITSILEKITQIEKQLTDMQADLDDIKARLTKVEGRTDDITKCVAGAGMAGIPALLSIPLMVMTQLNIPGIKDLNTQIQKQIGIYNPELARAWERNGGVLQAGAVLAGLAGMIGSIAYIANQCDPMMKTPAGQDTDLGKLSSKLDEKGLGSSQKDAESTQPDKQDAEAAEEVANAEAATAPSEELVDAQ